MFFFSPQSHAISSHIHQAVRLLQTLHSYLHPFPAQRQHFTAFSPIIKSFDRRSRRRRFKKLGREYRAYTSADIEGAAGGRRGALSTERDGNVAQTSRLDYKKRLAVIYKRKRRVSSSISTVNIVVCVSGKGTLSPLLKRCELRTKLVWYTTFNPHPHPSKYILLNSLHTFVTWYIHSKPHTHLHTLAYVTYRS